MRTEDRIKLAALLMTAAGCNALSGVNDFDFTSGSGPEVVTLGPNLGHDIPDDERYNGALETMECFTLAVPDLGAEQVEAVEVTLGLVHPWLSDLVIKVESPQRTVTTLLSRAGVAEPDDASIDDVGPEDSDLAASHPITFQDDVPVPAEQMGNLLDGEGAVCRDDDICTFAPSPGMGPGTSLADFQGERPAGEWRVCVADGADDDLGAVDQVRISVLSR